jgi:hypothetical protein
LASWPPRGVQLGYNSPGNYWGQSPKTPSQIPFPGGPLSSAQLAPPPWSSSSDSRQKWLVAPSVSTGRRFRIPPNRYRTRPTASDLRLLPATCARLSSRRTPFLISRLQPLLPDSARACQLAKRSPPPYRNHPPSSPTEGESRQLFP